MNSNKWNVLLNQKYQLSLQLFLFLNGIYALFSMTSPIFRIQHVTIISLVIFGLSCVLFSTTFLTKKKWIDIKKIAFLFGVMWAYHIFDKSTDLLPQESGFIVISLLGVMFTGAIACANNIILFLVYILPVFCTAIWLDHGQHILQTFYSVILPLAGVAVQHIIQRHNDRFTHELMSQLAAEKAVLNDLSMLDPLTGLYNRRGFQQRLNNEINLEEQCHVVLMIDIDHFKAYNDHYGHTMGDQVLVRVSAAIRNTVRFGDLVTRYGGEEFIILLTNLEFEHAHKTAERIRQCIENLHIPHGVNDSEISNITVSIGYAPVKGEDIESAIRAADQALYAAKNKGRNHILSINEIPVA